MVTNISPKEKVLHRALMVCLFFINRVGQLTGNPRSSQKRAVTDEINQPTT